MRATPARDVSRFEVADDDHHDYGDDADHGEDNGDGYDDDYLTIMRSRKDLWMI